MDSGVIISSGSVMSQDEEASNTDPWKLELEEIKRYCKEDNLLGQGGYGFVYRGKYKGQDVAIKQAKIDKKHYKSETEKHYTLRHPNLISCRSILLESSYRYLVLELAAGTMADLFKRAAQNDEAAAHNKKEECERLLELMPDVQVFIQIASGLDFLHSSKLVHADIKPENILITKKPSSVKSGPMTLLKLSDLGISKEVSHQGSIQHVDPDDTQAMDPSKGCYTVSTIRGSRGWISPELIELSESMDINLRDIKAKGEKLRCSTASDIFAYGLVAFYYLTKGIHPFGDLSTDLKIRLTIIPNIKNNKPINFESIGGGLNFSGGSFNESSRTPSDDSQSSIEKCVGNALNRHFKQYSLTPSGPHILIGYDSFESSNQLNSKLKPKVVGLLLPISDLRQIKNASFPPLFSLHQQNDRLKRNKPKSHLYCLFFKTYSKTNLENVIRLVGNNALLPGCGFTLFSTISETISESNLLTPDLLGNYLYWNGWTSLQVLCSCYSAGENLKELAHFLVKHEGIDPSTRRDLTGDNALLMLCTHYRGTNLKEMVYFLVKECGIDPKVKTNRKCNVLHSLCCCYRGNDLAEMIYFLVKDCGINPADKAIENWDALLLLCRHYDGDQHNDLKAILDFLVDDCGVDPSRMNRVSNDESSNAFLFACHYYRGKDLKQVLELLIDKGGYDVNKTLDLDNKNFNALHILCSSTYIRDDLLQLVKFLIEDKGIIVKTCDTNGWNALHLLCNAYNGSQFEEIADYLCSKGIDINEFTLKGYDVISLRLCRDSYKLSPLKDLEILINQKGFDVKAFIFHIGHYYLVMLFFFQTHCSDFNDILDLLYNKGFLSDVTDDTSIKTAELECKIMLFAGILYRGPRMLDFVTRIIKQVWERYFACWIFECWIMEDNEEAGCQARSLIKLLKKSIAVALTQLGMYNLDLDRKEVIQYLTIVYEGIIAALDDDDDDYRDSSSDLLNAIELMEQSDLNMST